MPEEVRENFGLQTPEQVATTEAGMHTLASPGVGAGLSGVASADLNADGIKDVVVVNNQTGQVSTVLSQK